MKRLLRLSALAIAPSFLLALAPPRSVAEAPAISAGEGANRIPSRGELLQGLRLANAVSTSAGHLEIPLEQGHRGRLTLDARLQDGMKALLAKYQVPAAALVAIEPSSGRVLAHVSHQQGATAGDVAASAEPPAASVFKVITAAALLDKGVGADTKVCYGGGMSRLVAADLRDDPRRDQWCVSMTTALAKSTNAVFAKLAVRQLGQKRLQRYAEAFGFGHRLPYDLPLEASKLDVPASELELGRTAAGFWHNHLSPVHGALIAATVANRGAMPRATLVDRIVDRSGRVLYDHKPSVFRQVIPASTARALGEMMTHTVSRGTARRAFHDPKGLAFLPGVAVAGKTGTLTAEGPYRGYNWWVGFAPADKPKIALAALVVNQPKWRIKASFVAREALRNYLRR